VAKNGLKKYVVFELLTIALLIILDPEPSLAGVPSRPAANFPALRIVCVTLALGLRWVLFSHINGIA
jgi:hypothetical protein